MIVAGVLALIAVGLLAGGSWLRLPALAGAGLLLLAGAEAVVLVGLPGSARALGAVPAAALLLGAGELGLGLADGLRLGEPGERRRRLAWLGGCAAGAAAVAFVVAGADAVPLRRSAVATVAGAALAALAVWLLITTVHALVGED